MIDEPIEETYFRWLYNKTAFVTNPTPSLTFYCLLRNLYTTEFIFLVEGDGNRAQDGLDVRKEFFRETSLQKDLYWTDIGCSVLEMLIALARKAEFFSDTSMREWFWIFLENLHLSHLNDAHPNVTYLTQQVMEKLLWRKYKSNGNGGIFPLSNPLEDQRNIEIWYQLHAYLNENDIL